MDKKHWYDGLFYSLLIDSGGKALRDKISSFIREKSSVVDAACGTGALVFHLRSKCSRVAGVELSSKMHVFASKRNFYDNVEFYHMSSANLSKRFKREEFDYAVISFALHEMSAEERVSVLKNMKFVAKNLIIVDFSSPLPDTLHSLMIKLVEFLAGKEHYTNHKDYMKQGGVKALLKKLGLRVKKEILTDETGSSRIFIV
ncbi:MAG: methyltransferase domain-containing protein [Nanoarchaeota archaeon]|nr:methyltransferase domain-containing protein [Nanoarchaeota archaeon]